jgi:hypothetical protein
VSRDPEEVRDPRTFRWVESGVSGLAAPREWDAVVLVEAPGVDGDRVELVILPDGGVAPPDAAAGAHVFRAAVRLAPPFRLVAVRRAGTTWAVGAVAIQVAELPGVDGDELALVVDRDGARSLEVDGRREVAVLAAIERLAGGRAGPYVLRAYRLAGAFWETAIDPL